MFRLQLGFNPDSLGDHLCSILILDMMISVSCQVHHFQHLKWHLEN